MKPPSPKPQLPDFDPALEKNAVWNLLGEVEDVTPQSLSPQFVQDTVRLTRLEGNTAPWWKSLLAPRSLAGIAVAGGPVLAAIALMITLQSEPNPPPTDFAATSPAAPLAAEWTDLEDTLASELLSGAAEDPSTLSDEEIVALLF